MLGLYVPVLVRFLLDSESLPTASALVQARHEHCLNKLNTIGPQYPQVRQTGPAVQMALVSRRRWL